MRKPQKKLVAKRKPSPPKLLDTRDLCRELVATAAFAGNYHVEQQIYKAVRQLQLLDKLATEAGILPNR